MYRDLREKADKTGEWRVLVAVKADGHRVFRANLPGDPLPAPGMTYGLPGPQHIDPTKATAIERVGIATIWAAIVLCIIAIWMLWP